MARSLQLLLIRVAKSVTAAIPTMSEGMFVSSLCTNLNHLQQFFGEERQERMIYFFVSSDKSHTKSVIIFHNLDKIYRPRYHISLNVYQNMYMKYNNNAIHSGFQLLEMRFKPLAGRIRWYKIL